ncbi:tRNA (guanosine(37)-N1)-methyltransferase TrmD [Ferviditalea candida]|uniref:tRNA (guanine-N(1)-)-methyltransferase n=1 Tax=Ferviditalea candida TaxID=3108399 RepID=A0ABU5ZHP4_9BACL|nr:tRNA (guanosine(37)-N1)-methyltransferase TrmD [Paenibacillaceae bacterium T2]
MKIDVLTLFPSMFAGVFAASILGKAEEKGIVQLNTVNYRDFSQNKHNTVDDYPYGGGGGMVLKPEPIFEAVESLLSPDAPKPRIILTCPQGERFDQRKAEELARESHLIFICGHYEGYDERIREHLVTDELSLGDFVLTGGEIPAMAMIDSVVRLLPGVLGNEQSSITDSYSTGFLEYPQYTRPAEYRGWTVPEVLLSGHHEKIGLWRKKQMLRRTLLRRPDLLDRESLTVEELRMLEQLKAELDDPNRDAT